MIWYSWNSWWGISVKLIVDWNASSSRLFCLFLFLLKVSSFFYVEYTKGCAKLWKTQMDLVLKVFFCDFFFNTVTDYSSMYLVNMIILNEKTIFLLLCFFSMMDGLERRWVLSKLFYCSEQQNTKKQHGKNNTLHNWGQKHH